MPLRIFAVVLYFVLAAFAVSPVFAQFGKPITITVTPEVAEPGVLRTIRVSGSWPLACSRPGSMSVASLPFPSQGAGLTLVTTEIVFSPCPPAGADISLTTTFTPQVAGVQTLTLTHARDFVAQATLVTRASNGARAATDLTGAWYDPALSGHGFSLYHSHAGSDLMAGAWYAYDSAGKPFWMLLNNVRWSDAARFSGDLFQVTSQAGSCNLMSGCMRPQTASTQVGRINGELLTDGRLRLVVTAGPPFGDPPISETLVLDRLRF